MTFADETAISPVHMDCNIVFPNLHELSDHIICLNLFRNFTWFCHVSTGSGASKRTNSQVAGFGCHLFSLSNESNPSISDLFGFFWVDGKDRRIGVAEIPIMDWMESCTSIFDMFRV